MNSLNMNYLIFILMVMLAYTKSSQGTPKQTPHKNTQLTHRKNSLNHKNMQKGSGRGEHSHSHSAGKNQKVSLVNFTSLERKLQQYIIRESHPMVRPVVDMNQPVNVTFGFSLVQIVKLDEHQQSITMKIWLRMKWINEFMTWDPHEWGNITHSRVQPQTVWTPDIFLEEDVGEEVTSGVHSQKIAILITSDGQHEWMVPVMLQSACKVDVSMFPFDIQNCKLVFTPWTHNQLELDLLIEDKAIFTKHYVESSEWKFISVTKKVNSMIYTCCPTPFVNMEYVFTLQRRPQYYIHNLVTPCILQMIIILSTFFLPLESGERVGVVITIILVFAVYLQVLRESLPESSSSTPLLSKFFIIIMVESSCLLIATCLVLNIHFKGIERYAGRVPQWARTIFLDHIAARLCINTSKSEGNVSRKTRSKASKKKNNKSDIIHLVDDESGFISPDGDKNRVTCRNYVFDDDREILLRSIENPYHLESLPNTQHILSTNGEYPLLNEVRIIRQGIMDWSKKNEIVDEWTVLAKVLDRLCFVVFLITYLLTSTVMLLPAYVLLHSE